MDREQLRRDLSARRDRMKLSQADLAARAGVSPGYVSLFESGKRNPEPPVLERIASALGVRLDYVLVGDDVPIALDTSTRDLVADIVRAGPDVLTEARKRLLRAQLEEWGLARDETKHR